MSWSKSLSVLVIASASACGNLERTDPPAGGGGGGGGGADAAPRADALPRADAAPIAPPCEGVSGPDGTCYFLSAPDIAGVTAWASTTLDCAEQGGQLAVVTTDAENALLVATYCPDGTCAEPLWLGLNDRTTEGTWVWVDGSPVEFTAWGPNEPNNAGGGQGEDCAMLATLPGTGPIWNDAPCVTAARAICERD